MVTQRKTQTGSNWFKHDVMGDIMGKFSVLHCISKQIFVQGISWSLCFSKGRLCLSLSLCFSTQQAPDFSFLFLNMMTEKFTKFYGYQGPLCNLKFSTMCINGKIYNSVEQYLDVAKAELAGDQEAKSLLWAAKAPVACRQVQIKDLNEEKWKEQVNNHLHNALSAKVRPPLFSYFFKFISTFYFISKFYFQTFFQKFSFFQNFIFSKIFFFLYFSKKFFSIFFFFNHLFIFSKIFFF